MNANTKKSNFQFSIFNFQLILILLILLFVVACRSPSKNDDSQRRSIFTVDTLWQPTGNAKIDSLLQLSAISPLDTNLVFLYDEIGDLFKNYEPEKAKEYYTISGAISEQLDWNVGRYLYSVNMANHLVREGNSDSALVLLYNGNELARNEKNDIWKANFAINFGNVYVLKQWYSTALNYYIEALTYFEQTDNKKMTGDIYHNISQVYAMLNLVEKAIEYSEKAVALKSDDPFALFHLGRAYALAHEFEKSNFHYQKAVKICEIQNFTYILGFLYYQLGDNLLNTYDLDKVDMYGNLSLDIFQNYGDVPNTAFALLLLSKLEKLKGDYAQSEKYVIELLQIAEKIDMPNIKRECYIILSELTTAQRRYRDNITYWQEMDLIEKTIANETFIRASAEMEAKYETEKKQIEIERQQNIISRQIIHRNIFAGVVAVSVVFLALLWYLLRMRNRRNLALTERNAALAEINVTKDKFFNIISHDLKNPVVAQRDALRTLVANSRTWEADRLAEYHAGLLKVAEEQTELVYNLLGWAQVQTGRITYTPGTFSLSSRLRADMTLLRNIADYKGISLVTQVPDHALVTGDANMLSTVIRNLLTNAIKFTPAGGQVMLEISPCRDGARPVSTYTVSVSDTGVGMSEEQIQNLFRLDMPQSRHGTAGEQGSGLGLIVCREFVEKHGSELRVESEPGKGSRFWFELRIEN